MKKIFLLVMLIGIFTTGCGKAANEINLGTGNEAGTYVAYAAKFAEMIQADDANYIFKMKETAGAAANLRLLREGFLDMAIVQSDILYDAVTGTGIFAAAGPAQGYAAVAGLYTEACQIVVQKNSKIQSVRDLAGKKVSVGEKESGTYQNAEEILLSHGLTFEMLNPSYLSFSDSAKALKSGEIEAFFCTAGAPTKAIADLADEQEIRLISISPSAVTNAMKMFSGYTTCIIPAGTYAAQNSDVSTIGVKAIMVASTEISDEEICHVAEFLADNAEKIADNINIPNEFNLKYAVKDIPIAFHAGAAKYFASQGLDVKIYKKISISSAKSNSK